MRKRLEIKLNLPELRIKLSWTLWIRFNFKREDKLRFPFFSNANLLKYYEFITEKNSKMGHYKQ